MNIFTADHITLLKGTELELCIDMVFVFYNKFIRGFYFCRYLLQIQNPDFYFVPVC